MIKISIVGGSQDQIYLCMSTLMKIFDSCLLYGGFVCLNVCLSTDDLLQATGSLYSGSAPKINVNKLNCEIRIMKLLSCFYLYFVEVVCF